MESVKNIVSEIEELKKKHEALVFSHYYEDGQIQDVADELGDSLFLAQRGSEVSNPVVLMAGMAFIIFSALVEVQVTSVSALTSAELFT